MAKHADKRSVSTDALETLGKIITKNEKRDAIHLAVENVIAGEDLNPGDDIGFKKGYDNVVVRAFRNGVSHTKPVGIVDPFLEKRVEKGQRFWLIVYPRQIRSLRHVWTHPDFPEQEALQDANLTYEPVSSELALQQFADNIGVTYKQLMCGAKDFLSRGDYMQDGGKFESVYAGEEFWNHYEAVTGIKVPEDKRGSFFSCSC